MMDIGYSYFLVFPSSVGYSPASRDPAKRDGLLDIESWLLGWTLDIPCWLLDIRISMFSFISCLLSPCFCITVFPSSVGYSLIAYLYYLSFLHRLDILPLHGIPQGGTGYWILNQVLFCLLSTVYWLLAFDCSLLVIGFSFYSNF